MGLVFVQVLMKIGKVSAILAKLEHEDAFGRHPEILAQNTIDEIVVKAMKKTFASNANAMTSATKLLSAMLQKEEDDRFDTVAVGPALGALINDLEPALLKQHLHCGGQIEIESDDDTGEETEETEEDKESRDFWE
jgi:hypothetical protein